MPIQKGTGQGLDLMLQISSIASGKEEIPTVTSKTAAHIARFSQMGTLLIG
jgi:hypothetical protein